MYDTYYLDQFIKLGNETKTWMGWTYNSAPQTLDEFPFMPSFIMPLYQSLQTSLDKLEFEAEVNGNVCTVHSNIAEKIVLRDENMNYYSGYSADVRSNEVALIVRSNRPEGSENSLREEDIAIEYSSDSVTFTYPEGYQIDVEEIEYSTVYSYSGAEERINIYLYENGEMLVSYLDVHFSKKNFWMQYQHFGYLIEIQMNDTSVHEWVGYTLPDGQLEEWDQDYDTDNGYNYESY